MSPWQRSPRTACLALALLGAGTGTPAQVPPDAGQAARYTGLHAAAQRGDLTRRERLLAAPADLETRDAHGRTPLMLARGRGYAAMVRLLELSAGSARPAR